MSEDPFCHTLAHLLIVRGTDNTNHTAEEPPPPPPPRPPGTGMKYKLFTSEINNDSNQSTNVVTY